MGSAGRGSSLRAGWLIAPAASTSLTGVPPVLSGTILLAYPYMPRAHVGTRTEGMRE